MLTCEPRASRGRPAFRLAAALAALIASSPAGFADDARPLPPGLSPWSMFIHADAVVKAVMIMLALASVATWSVLLGRGAALTGAAAGARRGLARLAAAADLDGAADVEGPVGRLIETARGEAERSRGLPPEGIKERAALALGRAEARAARGMARGTGVLATVGSVAPFVGLFGTVWGIMDSFVGISEAHTSNLAVVAPGIAEALLATAVGLVAAIPAVVIFNGFARATVAYKALLGDASAEVLRHLSRDLDRRAAAGPARVADSVLPEERAAGPQALVECRSAEPVARVPA